MHRNYEDGAWTAYDVAYQCQASTRRDLQWSKVDSVLYNEVFTGRARAISRCKHCLGKNHSSGDYAYTPAPGDTGFQKSEPSHYFSLPTTSSRKGVRVGEVAPSCSTYSTSWRELGAFCKQRTEAIDTFKLFKQHSNRYEQKSWSGASTPLPLTITTSLDHPIQD